jgi:hypothetical protein
MANGRLGHVSIATKGTSAVYTNNSGAEASVSLIGFAEDAVNVDIRIDDTSNALELSTTVATETYADRYLDYSVDNTTLITGAPTYIGRVQFGDVTQTTTGSKYVYEFYSNANTTTYTISDISNGAWSTAEQYPAWDQYNAGIKNETVICQVNPRGAYNQIAAFATPTTEDEYYNRMAQRDNSNVVANRNLSYADAGLCVDHQMDQTNLVVGKSIHTSGGYQSSFVHIPSTSDTSSNNRTSDSAAYKITQGTNLPSQSVGNSFIPMRMANRLTSVDLMGQTAKYGFYTVSDTWYDTESYNASTIASEIINESRAAAFRFDGNVSARDGGQILYMEWNPAVSKHYAVARNASTACLYEIDRDTMLEGIGAGGVQTGNHNTDQASYGITLINDDFTLPFLNTGSYSITDNNLMGRTRRIGENLWVLSCTLRSTSTAAEIFYSTDLKTWQTPDAFYDPYDYNRVVDDTTVRSASGVVTAVKSNIGNLGADGVLENNQAMIHYERTGLVLSNGDRILVYNRDSTNSAVFQVMGYEGS